MNEHISKQINELPKTPGCYLFRNKEKEVIYVGKAVRLKDRVSSYFLSYSKLDPKKQLMVDLIMDINFVSVDTEVEALILETNLIKKYRPKYNVLMMDDKNYSWIKINIKDDFPIVSLVRKYEEDGSEYFGPYPNNFPAKDVLKRLRKIFPYRTCRRSIKQVDLTKEKKAIKYAFEDTNNGVLSSNSKPCLYYHIGLCKAPCAAIETKWNYRKNIYRIMKFLRGEKQDIIISLEKEMKEAVKELKYEKAALIRDKISSIRYVLARISIGVDVDDIVVSDKLKQERDKALKTLFQRIDLEEEYSKAIQNKKDIKIECYDISNTQGTNPVGAMVVFVNGEKRPELYRKFKIRSKQTPDDFLMMREMLERRFSEGKNKNEDESFKIYPDLIIIDGGKGQLNTCHEVLSNLKIEIPHIGLAKRLEEIFINSKEDNLSEPFIRVRLSKTSESLYLIQRIRDEAHRYGITFHRYLRSQKALKLSE